MPEPLLASIGWSAKPEAARAGKEAAEAAMARLGSAKPSCALVFASSWFDQAALVYGARSVLGQVPLAGGSTAGEITPEGPSTHSCVVLVLSSPSIACSLGMAQGVDTAPREAGQQAAYAALQGCKVIPRAGFLLFGDGLLTNYLDVARGIQEVLGTGSLIVGGMTGDDLRYQRTYQYANDQVVSRAVAGILFAGHVKIGAGIEHGFAPISKPRRITKARAHVLYELDRQPAASVYEEYFGPDEVRRMRDEGLARQAVAYPLGIQLGGADQWLLRNVVSLGIDGSLTCSGELLEDTWLQLMIGSRELAIEAAAKAAAHAIRTLNQVSCVIVFDSVSRRRLLGPRAALTELAAIREAVGPATPLAGCYTYGEQAPMGLSAGVPQTVTQTGSVLVVALGT